MVPIADKGRNEEVREVQVGAATALITVNTWLVQVVDELVPVAAAAWTMVVPLDPLTRACVVVLTPIVPSAVGANPAEDVTWLAVKVPVPDVVRDDPVPSTMAAVVLVEEVMDEKVRLADPEHEPQVQCPDPAAVEMKH